MRVRGIEVKVDEAKLFGRMKQAEKKSMVSISNQILKDCNRYCKQDKGFLINSSLTSSKLELGVLIWDTPYARKQFFLPETRHSVNSLARYMWTDYAKSKHKDQWAKMTKVAMIKIGGF